MTHKMTYLQEENIKCPTRWKFSEFSLRSTTLDCMQWHKFDGTSTYHWVAWLFAGKCLKGKTIKLCHLFLFLWFHWQSQHVCKWMAFFLCICAMECWEEDGNLTPLPHMVLVFGARSTVTAAANNMFSHKNTLWEVRKAKINAAKKAFTSPRPKARTVNKAMVKGSSQKWLRMLE